MTEDELSARRATANEQRSELQKRILKALRKGPLTSAQLYVRAENPFGPAVQLALYDLVDDGEIERSEDFPYKWRLRN